MKKILYTASTFSHIVNFHLPYLKWFKDTGFEVHVAAGNGGKLSEEYADKVIPLNLEKSIASFGNFKLAFELSRTISDEKYDIISCHTSLAAFFTRIAIMLSRHKPSLCVNTVHGYLFDQNTPFLKRLLMLSAEKITARATDLIMVMNECDFDIAKRYRLGKQIEKIHGMGVNTEKFPPVCKKNKTDAKAALNLPQDSFVLLCAAEFSKRKNQSMLIKAADKLPENVYLVMPGSGAMLDECRHLAEKSPACRRIIFPDYADNIYSYISAADAAVSASRYEGLPFHITEALSAGIPAVVSDVKGNRDLISDGINGFTYPFDDVSAFTEKVKKLIDDISQKKITAEKCSESILPFSLKNVFPEITDIYSKNTSYRNPASE